MAAKTPVATRTRAEPQGRRLIYCYHSNCFDWQRHRKLEKKVNLVSGSRSTSARDQLSGGIRRDQLRWRQGDVQFLADSDCSSASE